MKKLKKILTYGNPSLRETVSLAIVQSQEATKIANALRMRLGTIDGYGLAANQLGFDAQIFSYRPTGKGRFYTILNPTIEEYDDEMWVFPEGCLSIPNFWFDIERPRKVLLKGFDLKGNEVEIEAEDTLARIFQHEIDHFNGKLVIDHLDEDRFGKFKLEWYRKYQYYETTDEENASTHTE